MKKYVISAKNVVKTLSSLFILTWPLLASCKTTPNELLVELNTGGAVLGKWFNETEGTSREFLGIPYVTPPVEELRFKAPQPISWQGTIDAKEYGPSCLQNASPLAAPGKQSEDCLSVNVHAPALSVVEQYRQMNDKAGVPVMVWIHGGAFVVGGSVPYPGHNLAQDYNVIVVTLNYRLGALGFLSHPALDAELAKPVSGNFALQDQQMAMKWVKSNIARFGGDPQNITVMGESAGSMSVCNHLVAPGSHGLAQKYIMQSGACVEGLRLHKKPEVVASSQRLVADLCNDEEDVTTCLRTLPGEQLIAWGADNGILQMPWGPTIIPDSDTLPKMPVDLISEGKFNRGSVILGSNKNEWELFQRLGRNPVAKNQQELNQHIAEKFPEPLVAPLQKLYTAESEQEAKLAMAALTGDPVFRCPMQTLASILSEAGEKVWLYSFEKDLAAHAYEIPYVFNNVSKVLKIDPTDSPTREAIQSYWTTFAEKGDPNSTHFPAWPAYTVEQKEYMILKDSPQAGKHLLKAQCDFWHKVQQHKS